MIKEQASYLQIMKATTLFGGVQVFNILITIIRSKIIAILLAPAGMGVAGLLTSTTSLIGGLTNFGLGTSAVRDVAEANESGDINKISIIVMVFRKLVWITGTLGSIMTLVLSPWLSRLTFGSSEYTLGFIWLSVTLLFSQLTSGQNVLLQGMRKLQYLAKANMTGSVTGLLVSVPIYYFWRIDGIVPAIILTSLFSLVIAWYFASKITITKVEVNPQKIILEGKGMLKMGFMLSLSGLIATGSSYLVRIFINSTGGLEEVGFYSAGFTIITTYVGLVFTAMSTDYYPRLSGIAYDNQQAKLLINQQAEVAILIIAPILTVFLIFINWVVIILYSAKFTPIEGMIHWAALGMYFKAASWSVGYIMLAKGASKTFFWSELIANGYLLLFNILGYKYFGLDGMGISFLISYILVFLQVYFIASFKYKFSFKADFYRIFFFQLNFGIVCFLIIKTIPAPLAYIIGLLFIGLSVWFSIKEMDKLIGLRVIYTNFRNKYLSGGNKDK